MRSRRLPSNLAPNAVAHAVARRRAAGAPLVDLTESNPTVVGLAYPPALLAPLGDPSALRYDPQPLGLESAREAVAAEHARRGLHVPAARIALTASTSEAYALLFKLLCDPGDAVLVPRPSYPLFEHLTALESVRADAYPLDYHGTWRIDVAALEQRVTPRTQAVLVVSPNNPTGSFLHHDDLRAVERICARHGLALIGDEVFADYPLAASPHAASVLEASSVMTCALGGLSKSAGLPQVKLGWIAFGGPEDEVADTMAGYEIVADTYLSVSTAVQLAAPALIASGTSIRAAILARVRRNLASLRHLAAACPAVTVLPVEGGWSAVVQVPATIGEEALVLRLIEDHGVLVHPGYFFDFARGAHLVVSLIVEPEAFDQGVTLALARAAGSRA